MDVLKNTRFVISYFMGIEFLGVITVEVREYLKILFLGTCFRFRF